MSELLGLETFVQVADRGSFTAAANALGVQQPTVSRRIADLEARLGTALVIRTTRSLTLTDAGLRVLENARDVLAAMDRTRDAAHARGPLDGTIRVAAPVSLTTTWLAPALPSFLAAHPRLDVELVLSEVHMDLVAEHLDVGVRIGGPDVASLTGRRLRDVDRLLVASPDWLDRYGPIEAVAQLASFTGLIYTPPGRRIETWALPGGPLRPHRRVTSTNGLPLLELARAGVGVGLLPDWLVQPDLRRGRLVRILPELKAEPLGLWVIWPAHAYQRAAARAFVDWLSQAPHLSLG